MNAPKNIDTFISYVPKLGDIVRISLRGVSLEGVVEVISGNSVKLKHGPHAWTWTYVADLLEVIP